jgi:hypothetical protein
MRSLRAGVAAVLACVAAGCPGEGGVVTLTVDHATGVSPALTSFSASNGAAVADARGLVYFSARSATVTLMMTVSAPISAGRTIDLVWPNAVSLDAGAAGWSSSGGLVAVDGTDPYRLRLVAVPMQARAGSATGSFVLDGAGVFK